MKPPKAHEDALVPVSRAEGSGEATGSRDANGRFLSGAETREIAAKGGAAAKGRSKLASHIGLKKLPTGCSFSAYRRSAVTFRRALCNYFDELYGEVSPDVSALLTAASIELSFARAITDAAALKDLLLATRGAGLHVLARENIMEAHALAKLEAEARRMSAASNGNGRPQITIITCADDGTEVSRRDGGYNPETDPNPLELKAR